VQLCLDGHPEKIDQLCLSAADIFDVEVEKGLSLLTIRHYREDVIQRHAGGRNRLLTQQTPDTIQMLFRS
jgi:aspartate kinase